MSDLTMYPKSIDIVDFGARRATLLASNGVRRRLRGREIAVQGAMQCQHSAEGTPPQTLADALVGGGHQKLDHALRLDGVGGMIVS